MWLQMENFHSFIWLSSVYIYICICIWVYISHFLYPFICWWTLRLLSQPYFREKKCKTFTTNPNPVYSLISSITWKTQHHCLYSIVSFFFLGYIFTHLLSISDKMGEPKERWKTVLRESYAWEDPVWFRLLWKMPDQFCTWSQLLCYYVRLVISPVSRSHGAETHKGLKTPWVPNVWLHFSRTQQERRGRNIRLNI